jgi:hypothetical protein
LKEQARIVFINYERQEEEIHTLPRILPHMFDLHLQKLNGHIWKVFIKCCGKDLEI